MDVDLNRIRRHIERITKMPRPAASAALDECREYVTDCMQEYGWTIEPQEFFASLDQFGVLALSENRDGLRGVNLVATLPRGPAGNSPRFCVGAHLDSRPDTVGADDNASAVAALLEIARLYAEHPAANAKLELELVFFDLEENGMLGGAFHAARAKQNAVDLRGMVSLEMLGYCDNSSGSQALPRSLVGLYPDTGNFIAVIGNQNSHALIEAFSNGMKRVESLPVETLAVPSNGEYLQATRLSDHSPFWDAGYAALMITDTSFLRNPYYHTSQDTLETLDMNFLHRVSEGSWQAVRQIVASGL